LTLPLAKTYNLSMPRIVQTVEVGYPYQKAGRNLSRLLIIPMKWEGSGKRPG